MKYYRIKHDLDVWGRIREFANAFKLLIYPAVRPFFPRPFGGSAMYIISAAWYNFIVKGQDALLRTVGAGWINKQGGFKPRQVIPVTMPKKRIKIKTLSSIGNLVRGTPSGGSVLIDSKKLSDKPSGDYYHEPWVWQKFTSIHKKTGVIGLVGNDIAFPILTGTQVYMPLKFLEPFPDLPFTGMAYGNSIREYPTMNAEKIGSLAYGDEFTITEYHFWGSDVWGKTDEGWICLCYANIRRWPASYLTTWSMETKPPIGTYWRTEQPLSDFTGE